MWGVLNRFGLPVNSLVLSVVFCFSPVMDLSGQTWTGNVSNSWHVAGNWDPQTVPGSGSTANIRPVSSHPYPLITQNVTVYRINLSEWSSGGELTITNGAMLTVTERFDINNNGQLFLDNGFLQFDGNGGGQRRINTGYTNVLIQIMNGGALSVAYDRLQLNGELWVDGGNVNLGNGLQLSTGKLFKVTEGEITVFGQTDIYGSVDGGRGNFVFDGDPSNNQHQVTIRSGGRFYMAPSSPENYPPDCPPDTPVPPVLSGGTIDFYSPSYVENNGRLYGGDAVITFYKPTNSQGDAITDIHNGLMVFKDNVTISNTAWLKIACKGTIRVEGNSIFQQNGNMDVGDGNFTVSGDAVFQNSGRLDADEGNIVFEGNVTIANTGGIINAGSSTIYFSGDIFNNSGTFNPGTSTFIFEGDGNQLITGTNALITFYNLIIEDSSTVQSIQNVLVLNDMAVDDDGEFEVDPGLTLNVVGDVTGDPYVDTNRPYIIAININAPNSITAVFDETLDPGSSQTASNYRVENESGATVDYPSNPIRGGAGNREITLTLGFNMVEDVNYYLIVNNVKDLDGYSVSANHKKRFAATTPETLWQWAGTIDSDWDKPGNWSKNSLPPVDAQVVIPVTPNNPLISSSANQVAELEIRQGASLTIGAAGSLSVDYNLENFEGNPGLRIESTAEGTGSLVHQTDQVLGTVKRYISGDAEDWHFLSAPVTAQSILGSWTPSGTYGDGTGYDLYIWNEPASCWVYHLNTTVSPTWPGVHGQTYFVPGRGYLYAVQELAVTKEFTGFLGNGTVPRPVTASATGNYKGFNLLGNPYPSSIDWKDENGFVRNMLYNNGGGYDIWVWSSTANNYGVFNSADTGDTGTNHVSRYIAPMQGFFVRAVSSGTFGFNNNARVHNEAGKWLKSAGINRSANTIRLTVQSLAGAGSDEVKFEFGHAANENGAIKLFSPVETAPGLYLPSDDENYTIRYLTDTIENSSVQLAFKAGVTGNYNLQCSYDELTFGPVFLVDQLTGSTHNFAISDNYSFTAAKTDSPGRFVIRFRTVPAKASVEAKVYISGSELFIDLGKLEGMIEIQLTDISGRIVRRQTLPGGQLVRWPMNTRGVFVVTIRSSGLKLSYKIVF
ncbi:Ig-like domain-containing protein [Gaoshiqia sp. Z1-71]|uniref:Ig-like domain-containing protein n=1 Tax=Gaoshiqia hydrogeniformans TaxID=3290090 RepID=UPI003BF86F6F